MKITKIEKQKKDKKRYNIFINNKFYFGVYGEAILKFGLRKNDEIDDERINEIKEYDELNYGKKIAYAYLSYKERSKKDLEKRLRGKKISEDVIENITKLLEEQKYLDDEIYAKNFLENKLNNKPMGKKLLQNKLMEKGIDKETIKETIQQNYTQEKEIKLAKELLEKYEKKLRVKNILQKKQKCYQYLHSRGFDYEIINKVVNID